MSSVLKRLVVGVSGSDASMSAAKYGIVLSKAFGCKLTAVYVVDTATLKQLLISRIFVEDESEEYRKSLEENGRRYLNYVDELASKKHITVDKLLKQGSISTQILSAADELKADLILLGGWEEKGDSRDSVSFAHREILKHSKCSVLVVKEQDIDRLYKSV